VEAIRRDSLESYSPPLGVDGIMVCFFSRCDPVLAVALITQKIIRIFRLIPYFFGANEQLSGSHEGELNAKVSLFESCFERQTHDETNSELRHKTAVSKTQLF
jgi:hypothetical protein